MQFTERLSVIDDLIFGSRGVARFTPLPYEARGIGHPSATSIRPLRQWIGTKHAPRVRVAARVRQGKVSSAPVYKAQQLGSASSATGEFLPIS